MAIVFVSFDKAQFGFAQLVSARLADEGYAIWGTDRPETPQLDELQLVEHMIRFADVVIAINGGGVGEVEAARRFGKPVLPIDAREDPAVLLPKLRSLMPRELFPSTVVLPTPLRADEVRRFDQEEHHGRNRREIIVIALAFVIFVGLILFLRSQKQVGVELSRATLRAEAGLVTGTQTPDIPVSATPIPLAVILSTSVPSPSATPTVQDTITPTPTTSPISTETSTDTPTTAPTITATLTPTPSGTPSATLTPAATWTASAAPTETLTPTPTDTSTAPSLGATLIPDGAANSLWQPVEQQINGLAMDYVPGGCLKVGGQQVGDTIDGTLCVEPYWISKTEITNAQYALCVSAGACSVPTSDGSRTHDTYYDNPRFADYPVINVTWVQAVAYADWYGGSLPSQLQWRYAVAGPSGWPYPWGNAAPGPSLLNYNDAVGDVTEVGSYPLGASWTGALDLVGNVWEWTTTMEQSNPVICGGSWDSYEGLINANASATNPEAESNLYTGFRVVLDPATAS